MPHCLSRLSQAFSSLRNPLVRFEMSFAEDALRLQRLDEIRVDDGVTQLFVDTHRRELTLRMAVASTAVIHLKALLALAEGRGF